LEPNKELRASAATTISKAKKTLERGVQSIESGADELYTLYNNRPGNALQHNLTRKINGAKQLDIMGTATIIGKDFQLFIDLYNELEKGVNQSAAMLIDSLMIESTKTGLQDTLVKLSLDKYMTMRGLRNEKETRKQINRDFLALQRIRFKYKYKRGEWIEVSLYGGTKGIKNGIINFRFNQEFYNSFKAGGKGAFMFMYFPPEALSINPQYNPHTYYLGRRIAEHKRENIGKPNADIISVKTLLSACPEMPTYEQVMKGDRHVTQRIIEPFERDLNRLAPSIRWEYIGDYPNDTDSTKDHNKAFFDSMIGITWDRYPDMSKLENGRKKRTARIKKAKNTDKKKQSSQLTF
jgi:hypothetical protein